MSPEQRGRVVQLAGAGLRGWRTAAYLAQGDERAREGAAKLARETAGVDLTPEDLDALAAVGRACSAAERERRAIEAELVAAVRMLVPDLVNALALAAADAGRDRRNEDPIAEEHEREQRSATTLRAWLTAARLTLGEALADPAVAR